MPPFVSRRLLLQAGLATGALAATGLYSTRPAAAADEFDVLRDRWAGLNTGGAFDPTEPAYADALTKLTTQAQEFVDNLIIDADRTALWADLPLSSTSGNFSISYTRLKTIALARATPGTTLTASTVTFTGAHTSQDLEHSLRIGTSNGASNIYNKSMGTGHAATVSGLPSTGTIYVWYWTRNSSGWFANKATFTMKR